MLETKVAEGSELHQFNQSVQREKGKPQAKITSFHREDLITKWSAERASVKTMAIVTRSASWSDAHCFQDPLVSRTGY
jgi:hypothetical protein